MDQWSAETQQETEKNFVVLSCFLVVCYLGNIDKLTNYEIKIKEMPW